MPPGEEAVLILRAVASAPRPTNGLTGLQATLFRAIVQAMLGLDVDLHALEPVEPMGSRGPGPAATASSAPGSSSTWSCSTWCSSRSAMRRPDGSGSSPRSRASGTSASTGCAPWPRARCSSRRTTSTATDFSNEIEAFGFIARASYAPDVFALHLDELRCDLGVPPTSPGNDRGRRHPALASRRHEPRPAGRGSEREGSNRHHVPRASEAGAMTAKPCDPTATAQEEGR